MLSRIKLKSLRYLASVAVIGWLLFAGALNAAGQTIADDLDRESLRIAVRRSIGYLEKLPRGRIVGTVPRRFSAGAVLDSFCPAQKHDLGVGERSAEPSSDRSQSRRRRDKNDQIGGGAIRNVARDRD